MNYIKEKIQKIGASRYSWRPYIPINSGSVALAISVIAVAFVVSSSNSPCLQAQTCSVGSDNEFTGNISLKGGTANLGTFEASGITADRTWTLPDETGTLALSSGALSGLKIMATDIGGVATTTDIYPLSVGTIGQVLKVDPTASFLEYGSINEVPTLTALKSVSTTAGGDLETNDIYPLSLTVSRPLSTNALGILEAGFLDPVADLTSGTGIANQELRVNSSATSLEFFTPVSGGAYSLIDSGSVIARNLGVGNSDEVITCWNQALDPTKKYKLILSSTDGFNLGISGYKSSWIPLEGDCSAGVKTDWEGSSYYQTSGQHRGTYSGNTSGEYDWKVNNTNHCYMIQGLYQNISTRVTSNIEAEINFSSLSNPSGFQAQGSGTGIVTNASGSSVDGMQNGHFACIISDGVSYSNSFADITGFGFFLEGANSSGYLTRNWALYEISY
tara:strand:- start:126 stop:1463 length:1338 start_codon:yes stop_codon:yes gene_type:complete